MRKRPFLSFMIIVGGLVAAMLMFIQSARFARIIKSVAAEHVPTDWGIHGDFSDFRVRIFPPGISIRNPKITLDTKNIVNLPRGSQVSAERLDLKFYPLQMFAGLVSVHEVVIVRGDVSIAIDPNLLNRQVPVKKKKKSWKLRWKDLVQIRTEALVFRETNVRLKWLEPNISAGFVANHMRIEKWTGRGLPGYQTEIDIREVKADLPKEWGIPAEIETFQANAKLNAKGLEIDQISFASQGVRANVAGRLRGNILSPKSLWLKSQTEIEGTLAQIQKLFKLKKIDRSISGRFKFKGDLAANLLRLAETVKAKGTLTGVDVRYKKWQADNLMVEGQWLRPSQEPGAEAESETEEKQAGVYITRAEIGTQPRPRIGGVQPASGGQIKVQAFRVPFTLDRPITIPLVMDKAHIHWLGAVALEDVYPMDFVASGPLSLNYIPGKEGNWQVVAGMKLRVDGFQLDNQKPDRKRKLSRVLAVKKLDLVGRVKVDSKALRPDGLKLSIDKTQLDVGGKIDFATGYDLRAKGFIDLAEFGILAENEIRGSGPMDARIHGPSVRVLLDFKTELKDAYYLNLHLGHLAGNLIWDDGFGALIIKDTKLRKGRTDYTCAGRIDSDKSKLNLAFNFQQGDVQDVLHIFSNLTDGIWWFPSSLSGAVTGAVSVTGGLGNEKFSAMGKLHGTDWDYYGERFRTVYLEGGYDRGAYVITAARAKKYHGNFSGNLSWSQKQGIRWNLLAQGMNFTDLDHVARLDVPIRGLMQVRSAGRDIGDRTESSTKLLLKNIVVRGVGVPSKEIVLKTQKGVMEFKASDVSGQGILDLKYGLTPGSNSHVRANLRSLDLSPLILLINPSLIADGNLQAKLTGKMNVGFKSGKMQFGSGEVALQDLLLTKTGASFRLGKPVSFKMDSGTFEIPSVVLKGMNDMATTLRLSSKRARLDGTLIGKLDLSVLEFLTSSIPSADGLFDLDFTVGGTLVEPLFIGNARIRDGTVGVSFLESPFKEVSGSLQFKQNVVNVRDIRANLAGGSVTAGGKIELFSNRFPRIGVKARLRNNRIKVYPFQHAEVNGELKIHGEGIPYLIDGKLDVESALSREKVLNQKKGKARKTARYTPKPTASQDIDIPFFNLNIRAVADDNIIVKNDLFDVEMKGDVTVVNTIATPRVLGTAETIKGKLKFKDQEFDVQSAKLLFDNPSVLNPKVNLNARTSVKDTKVQVFAEGRVSGQFRVELSSDPALPESEILSLLALGFTSEDMARLKSADQTRIQQGEAASLLLHSFDFNRDVKERTGFQIGVEESVDQTSGSSIFRPQTEADTGAAPKIVIKRKVGKKVDISVGSTVGVGTSSEVERKVEVEVTPGVSVMGVWSTYEGVEAKESQESYGVDLKVQKRFK